MSAAGGSLNLTPAQTVGPFFGPALPWPDGPFVVPLGTAGAFWIRGRVRDGAAEPVPDALIETWQADLDGRFNHLDDPRPAAPGRAGVEVAGSAREFRGFGRCPTNEHGLYEIHTVKPGPVPGPDGRLQAPHLDVSVFARGLLHRVVTRIYFPDEAAANAADLVLSRVAEERRHTLVAAASADGVTFDITLQGEDETVFFAV